jgi:hypothetical protein
MLVGGAIVALFSVLLDQVWRNAPNSDLLVVLREIGAGVYVGGTAYFLVGLIGLVQTARMSRVLHRHPWQALSGRYRWREVAPGADGYGSVRRYESALWVGTGTGEWTLLRVRSTDLLRDLDHGEIWLAIGATGPGVAARPPGGQLILVWRVRRGSRRERRYLKYFPPPDPG